MKPEDLPEVLSEEDVTILVQMAMEFPKKTFDWAEISEILESRGELNMVLDRAEEIRKDLERARRDAMSGTATK